MEPIPKSGYFYANKIAYLALKALADVMGRNGLNAILNLAHLPHLIENPPPDNLAKEFDFVWTTRRSRACSACGSRRV
jgi:hypothetical protein